MTWEFLIGGIYSLGLVGLGFWLRGTFLRLAQDDKPGSPKSSSPTQPSQKISSSVQSSGPLKSMTPYERSLEDSKEIKERIDHLLS